MSEGTNPALMSALSSVVVLGGLLAAGYYGWDHLRKEIQVQNSQTQAVIIELKAGTIEEIRASKTAAIEEIKNLNAEVTAGLKQMGVAPAGAGSDGASVAAEIKADVMSAVGELKQAVQAIFEKQNMIVERISQLSQQSTTQEAKMAAPKASMAPPMVFGPLAKTIYFGLGVARGPKINAQVVKVVPGLKERAGEPGCRANVSGFSDTLGNDESNLRLSQKRADYVAARLKASGLAIGAVRGWGERRLEVHTLDGADNENNRRVVIEMKCAVPTA
ncbi:MAG: OmpA family protein [Rhodospirillaceae bacterium]|jgi:outer membrane protein OmpA-like peptidoglycan-associated protein|nr:OmpA family protein [Rhodospirillaceae bacterium]